jgi:hypothetical protein
MSKAMVLYQRWAVEDPVLDCAIQIVDMARYREAFYDEYISDLVCDEALGVKP